MFSNAGFSVTPFASTAGQTINVAVTNTAQCVSTAVGAKTTTSLVENSINVDSFTVASTNFVTSLSESVGASSADGSIVFYGLSVTNTAQTSSVESTLLINNAIVSNTANLGYVLGLQANLYSYVYADVGSYSTNAASQVTNNSIPENSNGASNLDVSFIYNFLLSESSNGLELVGCTTEQNALFVDVSSITYENNATVDFSCSVAETFELSDVYLCGGVFNATVGNIVKASFSFVAGLNVDNTFITEGVVGYSVFYGAYLWNSVDDNQTPVWTAITTPSGNWTIINDTNSPNWVNIETT